MKIIGGTFGVSGKAKVSDEEIVLNGAKYAVFAGDQIKSVSASVQKERQFGWFGFLIGALLFCTILGILFSILGVAIGFVIALAGSFYSEKTNVVEMSFLNGDSVTLECSRREVNRLIQLKNV